MSLLLYISSRRTRRNRLDLQPRPTWCLLRERSRLRPGHGGGLIWRFHNLQHARRRFTLRNSVPQSAHARHIVVAGMAPAASVSRHHCAVGRGSLSVMLERHSARISAFFGNPPTTPAPPMCATVLCSVRSADGGTLCLEITISEVPRRRYTLPVPMRHAEC